MKQYPRIARLSTVGLRQHQAFDYEFHPFRTDFIGESGCGKSMIADLLQLILVGSEHFHSATDAMGGPRLPEGMVLREKDHRGSAIGYACLSLEIAKDKFVAIGAYIDTSVKTTTAFVIQGDYEEEKMAPLSEIFSYEDFMKENKILPIEELKTHLEQREMVCHTWFHKKGYYKYLFKNGLLSLDLSVGDKIVKDYAAIIQSFSRGKSIDTQKGENLKQFLFGDEARKALLAKYHESVSELKTAFDQYGENLKEIDLITRKQKTLNKLFNQEQEKDKLRRQWIQTRCMYCYQEEGKNRQEIKDALHNTETAYHALLSLDKIVIQQRELSNQHKEEAEAREQQYKNEVDRLVPIREKVRRFKGWLSELKITPEDLHAEYQHRKLLIQHKTHYERVIPKLTSGRLIPLLESILPNGDKSSLIDYLDLQKNYLDSQLKEKMSFSQFVALDNKDSLGHWALKTKRPLSLEEESILMHYKELSTKRPTPTKGMRYLPAPQSFFEKISVVESDEKGFWLHLNGLREYILWIDNPIFTDDNMQNLEIFFTNWTQTLKQDIIRLETSLKQVNDLRKLIIQDRDFDGFLEAYVRKAELENFKPTELDITSEEEFNQCKEEYQSAPNIENEYSTAYRMFESVMTERINLDHYLRALSKFNDKINQLTTPSNWLKTTEEIRIQLSSDVIRLMEDDTQFIQYFTTQLSDKADKAGFLSEQINGYQTKLGTYQLNKLNNDWKTAIEKKVQAASDYRNEFQEEPAPPHNDQHYENGERERMAFDQSQRTFEVTFKETVSEYLRNDAYRFENTSDCLELGRALLPAAFQENTNSDDIIDAVNHYLNRINETNRELNKRKLQKIRDLLDDISDEVSNRMTIAKRIDIFLNDKDKEITGGHRVRLKVEQSRDYPKQWIDEFQRRLNNDANDLISEEVTQGISFEEKMLAAFHECAPGAIIKPRIEKLLDPNAYLDVTFSMESSKGLINKGSTGQSYAGIALLCIARLSIIGARNEKSTPAGIRFMPIDEAEGLGSNYDMLYHIAQEYDYQIISLSINPLGKFQDGHQYLYMLQKNTESEEDVNYQPFVILCDADKTKNNMHPSAYEQ